MSMKNPLTPPGIELATFRFVARHLNHCATAVPSTKAGQVKFPALPLSFVAHENAYLLVAIFCQKLIDALFCRVPFSSFFTDNVTVNK